MTRIIAGSAGGRRLQVPTGVTRPTSERAREALFSMLSHRLELDGARVLDLYAGSGALGLEAASRGAAAVVAVESVRPAAAVARRNAQALDLDVRVVCDRVERFVDRAEAGPFDLVLADPPYDLTEAALAQVLAALAGGRLLAPGALVVVERSGRSPEPTWPPALHPGGSRRHGDTVLWFAEAAPRRKEDISDAGRGRSAGDPGGTGVGGGTGDPAGTAIGGEPEDPGGTALGGGTARRAAEDGRPER